MNFFNGAFNNPPLRIYLAVDRLAGVPDVVSLFGAFPKGLSKRELLLFGMGANNTNKKPHAVFTT
jgi:hypothetical protein